MLNDRDDKFEGHEESEYHFSDEDVSYEVDEEAPAPTETKPAAEPKESIAARLTRSKRMLISLGVFLVLVFVVYKMVAPSSEAPVTDIAATPQAGAMPNNQATVNVATQSQPQVIPPANQAVAQAPMQAAPVQQVQPAVTTTTTTTTAPVSLPDQLAQSSVVPQQSVQPPVTAPQQQVAVSVQPVQQALPEAASLPPVIPVQSAAPTYPSVIPVAASDASVSNLTAQSEKLMSDLQTQYTQQFNNFSSQTKALQDQVQTLTARVSSMEAQLSQLVQALTQQRQNTSMVNTAPVVQHQATEAKVGYNVQAIIPGRAWLKSENGETVTVAEGDTIRDVGRVTKIDPYDGVVDINTGNRVISLSYGNGG